MNAEVIKKLYIKQAQPLLVLNAPAHIIFNASHTQLSQTQTHTQGLLFVHNAAELQHYLLPFASTFTATNKANLIWIAYPKKSGSIQTNLTRDSGWSQLKQLCWEPVTQIAIDSDWSALRLKHISHIPNMIRAFAQAAPVVIPGVNFETRTVTPPPDFEAELHAYKLYNTFTKMSFTHQKEYVSAIHQAKKPETRQRRIQKCIEILKDKQNKN